MWTVLAESLHLHSCCQSQQQNAHSDFIFQIKKNLTRCATPGLLLWSFRRLVSGGCFWQFLGALTHLHLHPLEYRRDGGVGSSGSGAALRRRTLTPRPAPAGEGYFTLGEGEGEGGRSWLPHRHTDRLSGNTTVVKVDKCVTINHHPENQIRGVSDVIKKTSS